MARIQVLDEAVSELIAAGEVIERPASIVKELLENAIDAGASAVTVEIKQGGVGFIRITDDGSGIEPEDVPTAFLRHATSKVHSREDLAGIGTLGFRGEALASVCAVARVELLTKTAGSALGCRYVIHGGKEQSCEEAGCPNGTTIIVRDLFYNVPARLKFLKKDTSEGNAVQGIVEKIALSHPEISFKLIKENRTVLHTPGDGTLLSAVYAVFGREFSSSLLPVDYTHGGMTVTGFVSKPAAARNNRSMQHFFVNRRYVRSRTCVAALEEGYKHAIMVGKFPACVLNLTLDCRAVDVNVHPAKTEVRFVQERPVFEAVYFAVKSALDQQDILKEKHEPASGQPGLLSAFRETPAQQTRLPARPAARPEEHFQRMDAAGWKQGMGKTLREPGPVYHAAEQKSPPARPQPRREEPAEPVLPKTEFSFLTERSFARQAEPEPAPPPPVEAPPLPEEETTAQIRLIGELFGTYILFEVEDRFVMLDKHAAHERILYEQLRERIRLKESQILLAPVPVPLSREEADALLENRELAASMGFRLEEEGGVLRILEAPLILCQYDLAGIVEDLARNIQLCRMDVTPQRFDDLLHSMACRAAIKAHADNTPEELEELARQVYFDQKIRHCPHGRPVGITMSRYEIEKKFGRQG